MNKSIIYLSMAFFIFFIVPAWSENKDISGANDIKKLHWLYKADPENDAKQAIAKGDFRLRAVYGYALTIPGIQGDYSKYERFYGINPIEGTSDFIMNKEHGILIDLAKKYALKYNRVIMKN